MKPLSIGAQSKSILKKWKTFRQVTRTDGRAVWVGDLRTIGATFDVRIVYDMSAGNLPKVWRFPYVYVESPKLVPNLDAEEGPLPHVYLNEDNPEKSPLCLFDLRNDEWGPHQRISETTIPWTVQWLTCYELWRATGSWTCGGAHG